MITLCIDPAPSLSGFVVVDNGVIVSHGKTTLGQIKLLSKEYKIDRLLIEWTDFPIQNAGESFRDTNIIIGRIIEFYTKKCSVITIGRKEAMNKFGLKKDPDVLKFLKAKKIKLFKDSWQAMLLYYYYD